LNQIDRCGSWATWHLEKASSFYKLREGTYNIKNQKHNQYLANLNGDVLSGSASPQTWIVRYEEEGVYSLQSADSNNYVRCGNQGEVNAVGHNLSWERWFITEASEGVWCIENKQWTKWVRMGGSNEGYRINQQTYCGSYERWIFEAVNDDSIELE